MKRNFLYLAFVTLFALVVLLFAPEDGSSEKHATDTLLLPGISAQVNDVDRVEIITAGNQTLATLVKTEQNWQFEQMGGYRADWSKLRTLLADLTQARVVEVKTDKPEYYARLGVEDVAAEDAGSVLVKLSIGDRTSSVLVGHQAQGRPGQYVRLQNAAASALVDRNINISLEAMDWADSSIIDISAAEVAEVEIIHPRGERVLVTRISADQTDFDLVGQPFDREIKSSWAVNSLGSVFVMLKMKSVRSQGSMDWSDAIKMRLLMFSGVEIMADVMAVREEYWLRLRASHPASEVIGKQAEANDISIEQQEIEDRARKDVAKIVSDINQTTKGWVYAISKQKYDVMVNKPEDLLKPLESP